MAVFDARYFFSYGFHTVVTQIIDLFCRPNHKTEQKYLENSGMILAGYIYGNNIYNL